MTTPPSGATGGSLTPPPVGEAGYLLLPFDQEQFKDFIKGLLGRSQSISRTLQGPFEIEASDVQNLSALLTQRVVQQNAGILAQFTARVVYSDDSTVEVLSLAELLSYNEVRPVSCRALHLRWEYLVHFTDKKSPEKQTIMISYLASPGNVALDEEAIIVAPEGVFSQRPGLISFRIEHTARTWGADLEALLSGYFRSIIKPEKKLTKWIRSHHHRISLAVAIGFFALTAAGLLITTSRFGKSRLAALDSALSAAGTDNLREWIRVLANMMARGEWAQYSFAAVVFLVVSVFAALFLGIWSDDAANTAPPSFILLNRASQTHKTEVLARQQKKWLSFCGSLVLSLVLGIVSNLIFAALFSPG